ALYRVALRGDGIPRIEHSVSNKFEEITVKLIRSRLGHKCDGTRRLHTALGRSRTCFDFELLQRIRKWYGEICIEDWIIVIRTIESIIQARRQSACNRNDRCRKRVSAVDAFGCRSRRSSERDQFRHLSSIQRQLEDPSILNNLSNTRASCFD